MIVLSLLIVRTKNMPRATITSKGQTTLPKEVRTRLGVDAGDQVEYRIAADGTVTVVIGNRA